MLSEERQALLVFFTRYYKYFVLQLLAFLWLLLFSQRWLRLKYKHKNSFVWCEFSSFWIVVKISDLIWREFVGVGFRCAQAWVSKKLFLDFFSSTQLDNYNQSWTCWTNLLIRVDLLMSPMTINPFRGHSSIVYFIVNSKISALPLFPQGSLSSWRNAWINSLPTLEVACTLLWTRCMAKFMRHVTEDYPHFLQGSSRDRGRGARGMVGVLGEVWAESFNFSFFIKD